MLVGGDLFLSRVSQTLGVLLTVQECLDEARKAGLMVVAANGNHDKVSQEDIRGYCHVFQGMGNYRVVDEHYALMIGGCNTVIHMMPYFPETGSFKKRLRDVVKKHVDKSQTNILYIHQGINGALAHSDETNNKELPTHIFKDFDTVLVAHYHNRVHIDGTNIHYVGSSRQHNFGEDTDKGYTLIYNDGSFEYLDNNVNTKYITFEEEYDDIDKSFFKEITSAKEDGFRVRVIIHCKSTQRKLINKKDFVEAGAAKVEIKEEKVKESKSSSTGSLRFNKDGLKTSYSEYCEEKGTEDPEFGLKYIDNINL